MDKGMRQKFALVAFGVTLYAIVMNFSYVLLLLQNIIRILLPLLLGLTLAFILSVPVGGMEKMIKKVCAKAKIALDDKLVHRASILLTFFAIILIIFVVGKIAIPQIMDSLKNIGVMIQKKWPQWALVLKSYNVDTTPITDWLENLKLEHLFTNLVNGAGLVLNMVAGTAASTISVIVTGAISLVIMFYVLLSQRDLERQSRKLLYAYLKKERAEKIMHVAALSREVFTRFLSGQCVEALILGTLMFVAFSVSGLPYAGLVAMLTSVCSFIPYIGAFFSCAVGVLLTLISNPAQAILCFIVYQAVQFIENQFIYPHVVGNSVGLSPLWTLVAVIIGGKLFGLVGMVFFIPLVAVIYSLIREDLNHRLKKRNINFD